MTAPDMLAPERALPPGTVLAGKYRVEQVLGRGGMGIVLAAVHLQLDHRVAIKLLHQELSGDHEFLARFLREGRAAVKIKSEHVARVLDVGTLDDGAPFMVLEHLDGHDLAAELAAGPLLPSRAVDLVLQACEALSEAHWMGVVHRDLKPSNLFLTVRPDGSECVKVLDFGISKAAPNTGPIDDITHTDKSSVLGSPAYMSPEQLRNARDVDARTDIWSLGVTLYELLSCRLPFDGNTLVEVAAAVLHVAPAPLWIEQPAVGAELEAVIRRCLAKDTRERYPAIADLAAALAPFGTPLAQASADRIAKIQRGSSPSLLPRAPSRPPFAPVALPPNVLAHDDTVAAVRTATAWQRAEGGAAGKGRRLFVLLGGALVLVALALVAFLVLGRRAPQDPVTAAPPPAAPGEEPAASSAESPQSEVARAPATGAPPSSVASTASASAPARSSTRGKRGVAPPSRPSSSAPATQPTPEPSPPSLPPLPGLTKDRHG